MNVGGWYAVEFVAGPTTGALLEESEDAQLTAPRSIFVSKNMRVTLLSDPNFKIRSKSKALQQTGADLAATWQWDVNPRASGTHTLIAQVDVLRPIADGKFQIFNRYSRRVSVQVGVGTLRGALNGIRNAASVGDALTALFKSWSAMLLALGAFIVAGFGVWSRLRNGRKQGLAKKGLSDAEPGIQTQTEA
jgi:hypothetical protein